MKIQERSDPLSRNFLAICNCCRVSNRGRIETNAVHPANGIPYVNLEGKSLEMVLDASALKFTCQKRRCGLANLVELLFAIEDLS